MKTLLIAILLLITNLTYSGTSKVSKISFIHNKTTIECKYSQCQATAKSTGQQCKHCVSNSGDKFCYQHK